LNQATSTAIAQARDALDAAVRAVYAAENDHHKAELLTSVAHIYARIGDKAKAQEIVDKLVRIGEAIEEFSPHTQVIRQAVYLMVALGDTPGAVNLVDKVNNDGGKDEVVRELVHARTHYGDLEGALATARLVPEARRTNALLYIAQELMRQGRLEEAHRISDLQTQPMSVIISKWTLAEAEAKAGNKAAALKELDEAKRLIETYPGQSDSAREQNLRTHAEYQARAGDWRGAVMTIAILSPPGEKNLYDNAILDIVRAQTLDGNSAGAAENAEKLATGSWKPRAFATIASVQAEKDNFETARATCGKALALASELPEGPGRDKAFDALARAQIRARDFDPALKSAGLIKGQFDRCWLLLAIAKAQTKAGPTNAAAATFEEAARIAMSADKRTREGLINFTARTWWEFGDQKAAQAWVESRPAPYDKAYALVGMAHGMLNRAGVPQESSGKRSPK
jgi:tetratricopeptide (TPR) repeat protein